MIDIYNVRNVSKSGVMYFCKKFEQDHEEIAEFLQNEILKAAENGYFETKIFLQNFILLTFRPNIVKISKGDLSEDDIKKLLFDKAPLDLIEQYLSFNGFLCKKIHTGKIQEIYIGCDSIFPLKIMDDGLEVSWYEINKYID